MVHQPAHERVALHAGYLDPDLAFSADRFGPVPGDSAYRSHSDGKALRGLTRRSSDPAHPHGGGRGNDDTGHCQP